MFGWPRKHTQKPQKEKQIQNKREKKIAQRKGRERKKIECLKLWAKNKKPPDMKTICSHWAFLFREKNRNERNRNCFVAIKKYIPWLFKISKYLLSCQSEEHHPSEENVCNSDSVQFVFFTQNRIWSKMWTKIKWEKNEQNKTREQVKINILSTE